MSVVAIIAARWGSSRFPGKPLEPLAGHALLEHTVRRVQAAVPDVVVATPNGPKDARIAMFAREKLRVPVFMWDGPENDVLGRLAACAREHKATAIVRVTPDCPLVDPALVAQLVALQQMSGAPKVTSTAAFSEIDGLDCQVFTRELLDFADQTPGLPDAEREHVRLFTPWGIRVERVLPLHPGRQHRWTVDTPEDLAWLEQIGQRIDLTPPRNVVWDLVNLLNEEPELARYN